jgi:glycosyltransferase involved in cell wall biosynthesis
MFFDRERNLDATQSSGASRFVTSSVTERYRIDRGCRLVLYAGTFEPYQGLDLLVEASVEVVDACRDVRFLCAGGNEKQVDGVRGLARQRGVSEYFVLPGTLPPEEVESLLKAASILVSPRTSGTNTPLKIYSYLRSGVPILATRIVSHTQVLTDDVALLVEPRPDALGSGLLTLIEDENLCMRLAQNALRLAHESYSEEAYRRKVGEVFSFLAAKSRLGK